jgi:hypothetical protein
MTTAWQLVDGIASLIVAITLIVAAGHHVYDRWRYRRAIRRYKRGVGQ